MPLGTTMYDNIIKHFDEIRKIHIIDSHSHFGEDSFWPNQGYIDEYMKETEPHNVKETFAMSVPCPVIYKEDGSKNILSYYKINGQEINHYRVNEKNGIKTYTKNIFGVNPYKEANDYIYSLCSQNNDIKFNYVPLIHPYYYSIDDFSEHIKRGAKLFKIHGVACGVIPQKINPEFFKILEFLQIPLIIHTDFSEEENILFYNNTINWLNCLKKYNIKVYFAHAARLSEKSIDIINNDTRYVVGIGPDTLLNIDGYNEHNTNDFLRYCFSRFDIDKLIFDIDYPWNIKGTNNYAYDWDTIIRMEKLNLSFEEKEKVLSKNIKKFIKER